MKFGSRRPLWQLICAGVALGVVAALGLAPLFWWPATLIALLLAGVLFIHSRTRIRAAVLGMAFGVGYFAHALIWIVEPFLVDFERYGWMAPFAIVLSAAGLALFWAAAFWVAYLPGRQAPSRVWLLIATWSLAEFARAHIFTGFPWGNFAQIWVDSDVALLLSVLGPQGLSVLTVAVPLCSASALSERRSGPVMTSVLLTTACLAGVFQIQAQAPKILETGQTVRLVQPNAPQHQKWDPDHIATFFWRQIEYTTQGPRPDLVVWPETSVPVWLESADDTLAKIAEAAQGSKVIIGIQRGEGGKIYNSMVHLGRDGQIAGIYDKHHLVPFGEYVPFGNLMASFGIHGFATNQGQGFSAGPGPQILNLEGIGKALPLICYEAVFPQDVLASAERPDVLLQITNDAWFGEQSGPYQHLAQARMRAIEQGLPMIRVANTGVSAMIDPLGRIVESLPLGTAGYVDAV
ncbi:MAG: apolipoprotein N-acyltransferase, partial [Pseudomonadota bacterium]